MQKLEKEVFFDAKLFKIDAVKIQYANSWANIGELDYSDLSDSRTNQGSTDAQLCAHRDGLST